MTPSGELTIRVTDLPKVKALVETVEDAIGSLENGDHYSTAANVAEELRDALDELRA